MNKKGNCCPNCNQFYQLQTPNSKQKGNIPLLLECGHSMCEKCIRNIIQFLEPLDCKICHRDMKIDQANRVLLSQNKISLYKLFPVNIYMLGELTLLQMQESEKKGGESDENIYIDLQGIIQSTDNTKGECKECQKPTSKMCQQCSAIVCDTCFTKSHKNFVLFKNHVLTNIVPAMEPNFCKSHKEKSLDYYCKDCSKSICMDCMMVGGGKSCKNHDVTSIEEINQDFAKEIIEIAPKLDETFKRLTKTAVDVGNLLHNIENDTGTTCELSNLILTVEQHFSKLSSQIQKHKQEVIHILLKLKSSEKDSLQRAKSDIENSIKLSIKVLNSINYMTSSNEQKQLNLVTLLENAKQILETPWYLSRDENKSEPLKVTVNEDLCALITDYIHLQGNIKSVYRLYATSELAEGIEIPPPPPVPVFPPELPKDVRQQSKPKIEKKEVNNSNPVFFKNVPKYRNKSDSVSSLNSLESDSSYKSSLPHRGYRHQRPVVQSVQPFEESQHPKQLYEGSQELIYITHIVDPHNFYVQRSCNQRLVKEMIREFQNATSLPKPSINHVSEGKVYLMFNKADNMWQRCRVVSIDRNEVAQPQIHVFCIDFGSIEVTTIDNLRLVPPARAQSPYPLAINCSLANCEPKGGSWTSEDSLLIQNIIDNKQAVIYIRHIRSTGNYSVKFECDVTTFEDGVNIAHALVFHERAKMPNPRLPYPKILGISEKPKLFMNHNDFKPKSIEEVNITHIVSPDKFFVRKRHLQQIYENLCEDLDQEYSLNDNIGTVYLPEIGMVCAVNLEKSGVEGAQGWARGIVVELPGRGRARLLLPDTGAQLLAHWTGLRHIRPRFTTLRALATECYLAGVTPLKNKWSPASVALLQKFEDRLLELQVEDCGNRCTLGVSLYDRADPDNEICINNEMIKHKFAVTFGVYRFNKYNVEEQFVTNKSPAKPKRVSEPPTAKLKTEKENKPKTEKSDDDLDAKDKGPLRLEAKILNYQSPSLLYLSLIHQQKTFNELFEKIQKYYSTKKSPSRITWGVGDKCCTFCSISQTWRRAVIIEIEKENAKVFYSDFACIETVPMTNLRELPSEFTSIGDAAIKCHLCGVIPAVGDEWPSVTKEYLKELLEVYKRTFITKLGNFKNKSMPIEIWVYHTIQGGALEPNKSEWRCLNNKIIEQGLGIPDKNMEPSTSTDPLADDIDETLSFLNIKGSVREWLQLEPIPTKPLNTELTIDDCTLDDNSDVQVNQVDFISDWLPPEPLPNKEFMGMPTYIDNDGVIFLHDVTQQDTLDMIRRALQHRFKNPDPKAKYNKWTVGEPCIAMFFLDNQFYRGRVVEVNQDTSSCLIHYIDYGNEESCEFVNLRKSIALHQIPTQAHKCVLDRIRPVNASWDRQALDYLHKTIVEKQCFVKITREPTGDIIPIELKCNKLSINDHLVDFEIAKYTDGRHVVIRKYAPRPAKSFDDKSIEDSGPDYIVDDSEIEQLSTSLDSYNMESIQGKDWNKLMEEDEVQPTVGNYITYRKFSEREFLSNIIFINDINLLELNIIHDDETNILYEDMFKKIQEEANDMPPLNGIYENKACLALYEEDQQWYRASIMQYSESQNKVKVKYVDYGNIAIVSLSDTREIPETYTELPPASIHVKLYGVKVNSDVKVETISEEYSKTFLNKGPFFTRVVDYDDAIPLVELRDDNTELVYDSLIENEIFEKK